MCRTSVLFPTWRAPETTTIGKLFVSFARRAPSARCRYRILRRDGIVLHPVAAGEGKLSYDAAYRQMADEASEAAEWAEWDISAGDGRDD